MTRKKNDIKQLLESVVSNAAIPIPVLSTGSTLLNLACGGTPHAGWPMGKFYLVVGDSTAGKTFLAMSVLAEACQNSLFSKHNLIYDDVEGGCDMNLDRLFGKKLRKRIMSPGEAGKMSSTIEEFYFYLDDAMSNGPTIYVLDSMDALSSDEDEENFKKARESADKGSAPTGTYGVAKAKKNSIFLRRCMSRLRDTNSILIILSQTRDNLGFGYEKKKRSGGKAMRFYAALELWASVRNLIKKTYKGKDRTIGIQTVWALKKNRISGRLGTVLFDIYPSFGIDDLGSCIDYLVDEKYWATSGRTIEARGLGGACASKDKLIQHIEANNLESRVRDIVGECWAAIEAATSLKRKARY